MGRIMALDYGTKRIGIAVTDPLKIIATSLTTVHSKDIIEFLKDYFSREEVEVVLVGDPQPRGKEDPKMSLLSNVFVKKLKQNFPELKIERMDERYTSKMASGAIAMSGMGRMKRQDKNLVDKVSATILLQDYLFFIKK